MNEADEHDENLATNRTGAGLHVMSLSSPRCSSLSMVVPLYSANKFMAFEVPLSGFTNGSDAIACGPIVEHYACDEYEYPRLVR